MGLEPTTPPPQVGEITTTMTRIDALYREARDGANRCLLSYTLERTSEAESLCAGEEGRGG